ncbi:MAG: HupE/UreJ family protein [Stagnimonas sp.]|nr:HupE/UreJ family protein [Stagnimonas sp.]
MKAAARCLLWLLLPLLPAGPALAHPLAPALLELRELEPGLQAVLWRHALLRAPGPELRPLLPEFCQPLGPISGEDRDGARSERWQLRCSAPLTGERLRIEGLEASAINVIVRVEDAAGRVQQGLLGARQTEFRVAPAQAPPPVFAGYLALGLEHLLSGADHVLFVSALVLLIRRPRRLLLTVTAFTLGHSLTLALATLGWLRLPAAAIELAIALSIFLLACELLRPASATGWLRRWPGVMAAAFGLLHGLGFAGALAQIGLPRGEIPLALFAFNLGIELGQLLLLGGLLLLLALADRWPARPAAPLWRALPAYGIGALAAYWCLDRLGGLFST